MKNFRKVIFWTHLTSGIFAGIFIFLMCVTGAIIAFEPDVLDLVEKEMRYVRPPGENAQKLPLRELVTRVTQKYPEAKPTSVLIKNDSNSAVVISMGREGKFYVNPYNGEITGTGAKNWEEFFGFFERMHRWLALDGDARTVGKGLNDASNLLFAFLAISGLYIWFPRNVSWRGFKSILWFRRGLKGKAKNFNWHNTIGFWSSLVLIILTITGVVISYQWAGNLVYTLTGNELPPRRQRSGPDTKTKQPFMLPDNFDQLASKAKNHTTWNSITMNLPVDEKAEFTVDEGIYWNKFGRSNLTIDAKTGEVTKWEPYGEQNSGRKLRSWIRFTHTGETGGFIGQLIAFLACIGGAFLVWTGIALSLNRFKNWRKRNGKDS
ncbi:MAG: PepSY-associated TM helix domain-containing protein [Pyrinomonadaceae bacterium]